MNEGFKFFNGLAIVLLFSAVCLTAGQVRAETSELTEEEALSLNEQNYREMINSSDNCIVLFYRSDVNGTARSDMVMRVLIQKLPKNVKFFKINLKGFSAEETVLIAKNDIGKKVVPSIIPYKNGYTIRGKVLGPAKKEWLNQITDYYYTQYK